jgi:pRiA4b ORF-3-like protein
MKTPRAIDSFTEIATARIELKDTDPPIWREVEVPTSITLKVLHDIIQATIGWMDYHLWEFVIDGRTYGLPDDEDWATAPRKEAAKVRLRDVLKPGETVITYTYDFGDEWVHEISIRDIRPATPASAIPATSPASATARPRTAAACRASTTSSKPAPIPSMTNTRPRSLGSTITTRTPSTSCLSSTPSAGSPLDATPPVLVSQSQRPEPAAVTGGLRCP